MKSLKTIGLFVAVFAMLGSSLSASAQISREHRAIWMSPTLGSWPSSALTTEALANSQKNILNNRLDKLRDQNVNVLYYHVRTCCDAMYNSAYEPWAEKAAGARGVAPVIDPFGYLIEAAHARGIEVYAWINPYRYNSSLSLHNSNDGISYEYTHPDWLLKSGNQWYTLNPGIDAVQQRVVDVCKDIITKYDVDGLVMDDYFYPSGMSSTEDDAQYNAYKSAGGTLSRADWRRSNINDMVRRIGEMIEATKPYVRFGTSPAGVACPPNVTTEYGLPSISGDWQYNGIYSDPLNWYKNQYIDYMSPQCYWSTTSSLNNFNTLTEWWKNAAEKFGRHLYPSVDIAASVQSTISNEEAIQEVLWMRDISRINEAGIVYFDLGGWVDHYESGVSLGDAMKDAVYQYKALTPICPWSNKENPVMTSNVKVEGTTLTWTEVPGMRYTVYAIPENITDAEFYCQREYLEAIAYTNSYSIPRAKQSGYRWAVSVYDRYSNEYAPLIQGATQSTTAFAPVTLVSPINGATPLALFSFRWSGQGSHFTVQVAEDQAFNNIVGSIEAFGHEASSVLLKGLNNGQTYYWRVISTAPNTLSTAVSAVASFKNEATLSITSPAASATGVSLTPTIKWSAAESGAKYLLEISKTSDFSDIAYSAETSSTSHTVADKSLIYYTTYYARVTASKGEQSIVTNGVEFKTLSPTTAPAAPQFVNPATNGATIHSNEKIVVKPWSGLTKVRIEISTTNTFPARTSYLGDMFDFACESVNLADVKVSSKALVDGKTYYLRAYGVYPTASNSATKTAYSDVMTFVYSSAAGIDGVVADENEGKVYVTANDELVLGNSEAEVAIYAVTGQLVNMVTAAGNYSLDYLATGTYIIKVKNENGISTVKFVK